MTTTEVAVITATGLTKRFGATEAVRGVDLKVVAGEPVRAAFSRFILQPRRHPRRHRRHHISPIDWNS